MTETYTFEFNGTSIKTTVTSKGDIAGKWVNEVRNYYGNIDLLVVLDTEGHYPQHHTKTRQCPVLQLCIGSRCLIYQIYHTDFIPNSLFELLKDPGNTFVGVAVKDDVRLLKKNFGSEVSNASDLSSFAAQKLDTSEYEKYSLRRLCDIVLHVDLEKNPSIHQHSDWREFKLTKKQIRYASFDAASSFQLG